MKAVATPFCRSTSVRCGFTLVELLVVIGIIALLMSILLPSLNRAREQARTIACLSNLRSIMTGVNMYAAETKGIVLPIGVNRPSGQTLWWGSILVEGRYVPSQQVSASEVTGNAGPLMSTVFFCPAGDTDMLPPGFPDNASMPASRTDARGGMAFRQVSPDTGMAVDVWYGINGDHGNSISSGPPCRRKTSTDGIYMKMTMIRRPTDMVMFFDGAYYHHMNLNANRLNARHGGQKQTNLAFFDGHAETVQTADLPGGIGVADPADFSLANLNATPVWPKWRLDQK